jgi:hypothetical protein
LRKQKTLLAVAKQGSEKRLKIGAYFYLLGSRVLGSTPRRLVKNIPPSRHTIPVWDGVIADHSQVYFCALVFIGIEGKQRL